jgi:hypothetical protein
MTRPEHREDLPDAARSARAFTVRFAVSGSTSGTLLPVGMAGVPIN